LDFSGFERAIDAIGGIDLDVPRGFVDSHYPVPGKEDAEPESARYETLNFQAGRQHFDGTTALKYVRSRQAEGEEGTDYARSQRQQRVILAFKDKVLSPSVWLNFKKTKELKQIFSSSVKTDLKQESYWDMAKLGLKIDQTKIRTGALDQGSEAEDIPALLYNPPVNLYGQWVLVPVNNDWQAVFTYVAELFYQ
jgi:anionic cell wall polymer biosynthesis LytR-Cps2A-Psr (LCP) family protein